MLFGGFAADFAVNLSADFSADFSVDFAWNGRRISLENLPQSLQNKGSERPFSLAGRHVTMPILRRMLVC